MSPPATSAGVAAVGPPEREPAAEAKVIKVVRRRDERSVALGQSPCDVLGRNGTEQPAIVVVTVVESHSHPHPQRLGNSANQEQEAAVRAVVRGARFENRVSRSVAWERERVGA